MCWYNGSTVLNWKWNFMPEMGTVSSVQVKKITSQFYSKKLNLLKKTLKFHIEMASKFFPENYSHSFNKAFFSANQVALNESVIFSPKQILPFPSPNRTTYRFKNWKTFSTKKICLNFLTFKGPTQIFSMGLAYVLVRPYIPGRQGPVIDKLAGPRKGSVRPALWAVSQRR